MSKGANTKAQKAASSKKTGFDLTALPQVNLLPKEVTERRELKSLKGRIGIAFIALFVVLGLGYGAVHLEKAAADRRYEQAQDETIRLKAEEAKYAEVPLVLGQISKIEDALRDGMYREILWKDYLGAIAATLPDDGIISTLAVSAAADELQDGGIGRLTFTANLKTMPNTVEWINALNEIPGFSSARFGTATYLKGDKGGVTYELTGTVQLTEDIYSLRFEPQETEEDADAIDS
jgi:hypothetical protein